MDELTVGSLCSGYMGADAAIAAIFDGARTIWTADNDGDVATLLSERYAGPNLGDIKHVEWATVERPRVIVVGFPCQDISPAGRRAGIAPDTRSGLWTWIAYVIATLKPDYVFIENSRGLTSAKAHSDVESCPWCMGGLDSKSALRALGRVLGDLANIRYDTEWCVVRASDVGAPHERARAFVWAWRRDVADPGCLAFRGQARDVASETRTRAAIEAGRGQRSAERERVWPDDRDDREHAADAAGVRGGSRGQSASRPAAGASGVSERRDRASDDADAEGERRAQGRAERARVVGGSDDGSSRSATADAGGGRRETGRGSAAEPPAHGRRRETDARGDAQRRSFSVAADADDEPGVAQHGGRSAGAGGVVGARRGESADASGAGLEVGSVEPARDERAPAQRDRRDGDAHDDADAESERRQRGTVGVVHQAGRERLAHDVEPAADADRQRRHVGERTTGRRKKRRTAAGGIDTRDAPEGFIWRVGDDDFTASIKAWEAITGRPAPLPAVPNRNGDWRLNPRFSEWMMGLPDGWVTGVENLSRAAMLRIIGNGLVPAQGALAIQILTARAAEIDLDDVV